MQLSGKFFLTSLCALSMSAQAQLRTIPGEAKEGDLRHVHEAIVSINGSELRLAPGAQIRDESNRLVVPAAVPPGSRVKYLLDSEGLVRQVWILSPQEASKN